MGMPRVTGQAEQREHQLFCLLQLDKKAERIEGEQDQLEENSKHLRNARAAEQENQTKLECHKNTDEEVDTKGGRGVEANSGSLVSEARYSLSYGPPSDSSSAQTESLVSCQQREEEEVENGGLEQTWWHCPARGQMESEGEAMGPGWTRHTLPGQSGALQQNCRYTVFCDRRGAVYWCNTAEPGRRLVWRGTGIQATSIVTSPCGGVVWRLWHNTAYYQHTGSNGKWTKLADNVVSLWLGATTGWLVLHDGGLVYHTDLSQDRPCTPSPRTLYIGLDVKSVAEHQGRLVVLVTDDAGNCQLLSCPTASLPETTLTPLPCPLSLVSVFCLGPSGELVAADQTGQVRVSLDWQVWAAVSLHLDPGTRPAISVGGAGLLVAAPCSTHLLVASLPLTAYRWNRLPGRADSVVELVGGARDAYSGRLLLLSEAALLSWDITSQVGPVPVPLPTRHTAVLALAAMPDLLWLLDSQGGLYSKQSGAEAAWKEMSLPPTPNLPLTSISLSAPRTAWALDWAGGAWVRQGGLGADGSLWLQAPDAHLETVTARLVQVVVGGKGEMVWARDCQGGVWVRQVLSNVNNRDIPTFLILGSLPRASLRHELGLSDGAEREAAGGQQADALGTQPRGGGVLAPRGDRDRLGGRMLGPSLCSTRSHHRHRCQSVRHRLGARHGVRHPPARGARIWSGSQD